MSATFGWKAVIDTDMQFSEFYNADHTVMVRFLPQYPLSYSEPLLAVNGLGTYVVGQGDFGNGRATHLIAQIGDAVGIYVEPLLESVEWHHLAVVRAGNDIRLYLNGHLSRPIGAPSPDHLTLTNVNSPAGTLPLGRMAAGSGPTVVDGDKPNNLLQLPKYL